MLLQLTYTFALALCVYSPIEGKEDFSDRDDDFAAAGSISSEREIDALMFAFHPGLCFINLTIFDKKEL